MNTVLLGIITTIYTIVSLNYLYQHHYGFALVFGAYALGNIGLIIAGGNI